MEALFDKDKTSKSDVFSSPSHRMSQRPPAVRSGEGLGFQDFGSTFGSPKRVVTNEKSSKSKSKPATAHPVKPPRAASSCILEDDSDDELLLSSQNSMGGDATSSSKRVVEGKNSKDILFEEETVRVGGRVLAAHPDYKPSSRDAVKKLRFTRTKNSSTSKPSSLTVKDAPQSPTKPPQRRIKPRPKPDSSPESTPRPAVQKRGVPLHEKEPKLLANAGGERAIQKPTFSSSRRELQEFQMSLQAKENVSDGAWSGDASSTWNKKDSIPRVTTLIHIPEPIPLPSPLKTKAVSRETTFPNLSPLSSFKGKGKTHAKSTNEDDTDLTDGQGRYGGPKPFPMNSQMLVGIDRQPKSPSARSLGSTKRTSSGDSSAEQERTVKKTKDSGSKVVELFDYLQDPMEDDSLDMGHAGDPSRMCPYCDQGLPSHPTPFLQHLLATARTKSVSDPRPRNRSGLKAPLTIYISVCQRHRFESHQLPIAIERGWPRTIDFTKVPIRVKRMKKDLEAIILDRDDTSDIEDFGAGEAHGGSRRKSLFWREVKKEVKRQGSRTVAGVKGQFASFDKTQPGYYGEQGSVIIHQTLFDLFPPSSFDASLIAPLIPAEFIQRILVPEAAVRLIAQDLCVDMDDAIATLRDSAQYGVAMFPDTSENRRRGLGKDDDDMGVADQIVMERAKVRRKELAEEEKVEKEMLEEERAAQRAEAWKSRREKTAERAQQASRTRTRGEEDVETEDAASEVSEAGTTRKTRRATKQRVVTGGSESDAMSVDEPTNRWSARIAKKRMQDDGLKVPLRPSESDSDSMEVMARSKHKASTRWNKTRERRAEPDVGINMQTTTSRERQKQFSIFASLNSDGEHEDTPRPARQRTKDTSALTKQDDWSNDGDSDASNAIRRSRRLVYPPIKKGGSYSWLFSEKSSSDSP